MIEEIRDALQQFALKPEVVVAYCFGIVLLFGWNIIKLLRQAKVLLDALNNVVLDLLPSEVEPTSLRIPTDELRKRFVGDFNDYSKRVARHFSSKLPVWNEFVETLIFPRPDSDAPIKTTVVASKYLNDDTVVSPHIALGTFRSLPNILTGLGILGTFVGLAAGVGSASDGLGSMNSAEDAESLRQLLGGSSLAFWTSIVGISCSLNFLLIERNRSREIRKSLDTWVFELEKRMTYISSESIALDQLHETRQVRTILETIRQSQSMDSPERVIEHAIKQLSGAIQSLVNSEFDQFSTTVSELNSSLLETTRLHKSSQDDAQNTLSMLQESVDSLIRVITKRTDLTTEHLQDTANVVSNEMKSTASKLKNVADGLNKSCRSIDTFVARIDEMQRSEYSTISTRESIHSHEDILQDIRHSFSSLQDSIVALTDVATKQLNAMKQFSQDQNRDTSGSVEPVVVELKNAVVQLEAASQSLSRIAPKIDRRLSSDTLTPEDVRHSFSSLQDSIMKLTHVAIKQLTVMKQFSQDQTKDVSRKVEPVVVELRDAVVQLQSVSRSFQVASKQLTAMKQFSQDQTKDVSRKVEPVVVELRNAVVQLEAVSQSLSRSVPPNIDKGQPKKALTNLRLVPEPGTIKYRSNVVNLLNEVLAKLGTLEKILGQW